jgi:IS30 family transposase
MKYRRRIYYTETDKALMWERWRQGESLHAIARLFDRNHSSIGGILVRTGGIPPVPRRRSHAALALSEREEISRGLMAGLSARAIARSLRNGGRGRYRAKDADEAAWRRAVRPKRCKLVRNPTLARLVAEKLRLEWSPYQVAGWLKRTYPQDETRQVSHETIYRTLFIQARGALKKELLQHLRRTRGMRRSRHYTQKTPDRGRITETVSIRERPAEAEDRAVPGHWEGDLFFGSNNSQIATLVERRPRYHPHQPWQRGSNENTNGLLRQYFPKGMDLSDINQNKLNAVARRLNERPRETLDFATPAECFAECVALTG